ncbi:NCK5L protein, partial [Sterrhoptilus dennistouni]|nr:NCK5L protein [Sterrhoptilus dennistouni]
ESLNNSKLMEKAEDLRKALREEHAFLQGLALEKGRPRGPPRGPGPLPVMYQEVTAETFMQQLLDRSAPTRTPLRPPGLRSRGTPQPSGLSTPQVPDVGLRDELPSDESLSDKNWTFPNAKACGAADPFVCPPAELEGLHRPVQVRAGYGTPKILQYPKTLVGSPKLQSKDTETPKPRQRDPSPSCPCCGNEEPWGAMGRGCGGSSVIISHTCPAQGRDLKQPSNVLLGGLRGSPPRDVMDVGVISTGSTPAHAVPPQAPVCSPAGHRGASPEAPPPLPPALSTSSSRTPSASDVGDEGSTEARSRDGGHGPAGLEHSEPLSDSLSDSISS